jgi:hypothetical protein
VQTLRLVITESGVLVAMVGVARRAPVVVAPGSMRLGQMGVQHLHLRPQLFPLLLMQLRPAPVDRDVLYAEVVFKRC